MYYLRQRSLNSTFFSDSEHTSSMLSEGIDRQIVVYDCAVMSVRGYYQMVGFFWLAQYLDSNVRKVSELRPDEIAALFLHPKNYFY